MGKFIKTFFIVSAVLVIAAVVGVYIFLKTVDLNQYKSRIAEQITKYIQRDVQMREMSLNFSLFQGATLNLSGLSIMDHPSFSSEVMVYVDSVHLDVDLLTFLLKKTIMISKVELHSLRVNIVRNKIGEINVQDFSQQLQKMKSDGKAESPAMEGSALSQLTKKTVKDGLDISALLIRSIHISDGTFFFVDYESEPPIKIPVNKIDFQISNLSLSAPFPFKLSAALWSEEENIQMHGLAHVNVEHQQARIDDLKIDFDVSAMNMDKVYAGFPALKKLEIKNQVKGHLFFDVHQMLLGKEGLLVLSSDGRVTDGQIQLGQVPVPIQQLQMDFEMTEVDMTLKEMEVLTQSGLIRMSGRMMDYLTDKKFIIDMDMADFVLHEWLTGLEWPVEIDGKFYSQFKGNGRGIDIPALKSQMKGDGKIQVLSGRLMDVNILKVVIDKISFVPELAVQIQSSLPEKYRETLKQKDTLFNKIEMDVAAGNGVMTVSRVEMSSDGFSVLLKGTLDFDQNCEFTGDLLIEEELSKSLIAGAQELSSFLDNQKKIRIPLRRYSGKLSDFRTYPDVGDVFKRAIRQRGRMELQKVLNKVFDVEDQSSDSSPDGQTSTQDSADGSSEDSKKDPVMSPEEALIEDVLNIIPIFNAKDEKTQ